MKTVRKARYVYPASRALTEGRRKAAQEGQERAEELFERSLRRAAHRVASGALADCARHFNMRSRSEARIVGTIGSWSLLHSCLGDEALGLGPQRATEILQTIVPLITELSALTERATNAGGTL